MLRPWVRASPSAWPGKQLSDSLQQPPLFTPAAFCCQLRQLEVEGEPRHPVCLRDEQHRVPICPCGMLRSGCSPQAGSSGCAGLARRAGAEGSELPSACVLLNLFSLGWASPLPFGKFPRVSEGNVK